jgi:hypothetical protein
VDEVETAVAEAGARGLTELWDVTRDVDARLGPYPEFMIELAPPCATSSAPACRRSPAARDRGRLDA